MHLQVPNNLINDIKSLYETTLIKIKADRGKTIEVFEVNQGLRQGCVLSPLVYNILRQNYPRMEIN